MCQEIEYSVSWAKRELPNKFSKFTGLRLATLLSDCS